MNDPSMITAKASPRPSSAATSNAASWLNIDDVDMDASDVATVSSWHATCRPAQNDGSDGSPAAASDDDVPSAAEVAMETHKAANPAADETPAPRADNEAVNLAANATEEAAAEATTDKVEQESRQVAGDTLRFHSAASSVSSGHALGAAKAQLECQLISMESTVQAMGEQADDPLHKEDPHGTASEQQAATQPAGELLQAETTAGEEKPAATIVAAARQLEEECSHPPGLTPRSRSPSPPPTYENSGKLQHMRPDHVSQLQPIRQAGYESGGTLEGLKVAAPTSTTSPGLVHVACPTQLAGIKKPPGLDEDQPIPAVPLNGGAYAAYAVQAQQISVVCGQPSEPARIHVPDWVTQKFIQTLPRPVPQQQRAASAASARPGISPGHALGEAPSSNTPASVRADITPGHALGEVSTSTDSVNRWTMLRPVTAEQGEEWQASSSDQQPKPTEFHDDGAAHEIAELEEVSADAGRGMELA